MAKDIVKEKGRGKLIRDKANALKKQPTRKGPTKEFIEQAGRHRAIEAAKKHLTEAQQTAAPEQEQPYSAVDTVESVAAYGTEELIQYAEQPHPKQSGNVFHRETSSQASTRHRKPTRKRQTRNKKLDARRRGTRNVFHRETQLEGEPATRAATPKEQMRRQLIEKIKRQKADEASERSKNLFHGETSFDEGQTDHANIPKVQTLGEAKQEAFGELRGHSENVFHRETHFEAESIPPARRSRPQTYSATSEPTRSSKKAKGHGVPPPALKPSLRKSRGEDSRRTKPPDKSGRAAGCTGILFFTASARRSKELSGQTPTNC